MVRPSRLWIAGALLVLAAAAYWIVQSRARAAPMAAVSAVHRPTPPPDPNILLDPIVPGRPVTLDHGPRAPTGDWLKARPGFQYSHSSAERGGVTPCASQPVDVSGWEDWTALGQGRFVVPKNFSLDAAGLFDLIIHLHGDEPIRRELVESGQH